jgi:hypothetical protein
MTDPFRRRWGFLAAPPALRFLALSFLTTTALGGGPPSISFSPNAWDYGTIDPGTTASKTFTLTNSGGSATGALTVGFSAGSSPAFSKSADNCSGASIGPGKTCSVTIQYAPSSAGSSDSATLTAMSKRLSGVLVTASLTGASTPKSEAQLDCESYDGTFSVGTGDTFWTCVQWVTPDPQTTGDQDPELANNCPGSYGSSPDPSGQTAFPMTRTSTCTKTRAQIVCESYDGTFSLGTGDTFWTCVQWVTPDPQTTGDQDPELANNCPGNYASGLDPMGQTAFPVTRTSTCTVRRT